MNDQKNVWAALVVVAIIAIGGYAHLSSKIETGLKTVESSLGAFGSRFPNGLAAGPGNTVNVDGEANFATTTTGQLTQKGVLNATSTTATAATLVANDFIQYDTFSVSPNTSSLTYTIPASSTLATFLPVAGMKKVIDVCNATSTAATTLSFVASTGIDLETASSTSILARISPNSCGQLRILRLPATASTFDLSVSVNTYAEAD